MSFYTDEERVQIQRLATKYYRRTLGCAHLIVNTILFWRNWQNYNILHAISVAAKVYNIQMTREVIGDSLKIVLVNESFDDIEALFSDMKKSASSEEREVLEFLEIVTTACWREVNPE